MTVELTPTQQRLYDRLKDGDMHTKQELRTCLGDEMSIPNNLSVHITLLKKKIEPAGLTVVCVVHKGLNRYRLVRLLSSANDGRT
jgi:hypothetical protein